MSDHEFYSDKSLYLLFDGILNLKSIETSTPDNSIYTYEITSYLTQKLLITIQVWSATFIPSVNMQHIIAVRNIEFERPQTDNTDLQIIGLCVTSAPQGSNVLTIAQLLTHLPPALMRASRNE